MNEVLATCFQLLTVGLTYPQQRSAGPRGGPWGGPLGRREDCWEGSEEGQQAEPCTSLIAQGPGDRRTCFNPALSFHTSCVIHATPKRLLIVISCPGMDLSCRQARGRVRGPRLLHQRFFLHGLHCDSLAQRGHGAGKVNDGFGHWTKRSHPRSHFPHGPVTE